MPTGGLPSTTGTLLFGIGTRANNSLGSATIITPIDSYGNLGTTYPASGTKYTSYVDSGTNMFTFLDSATSGLPLCKDASLSSYYCPPGPARLSATIFGGNNQSAPVTFDIADPSGVSSSVFILGTLGAEMPGFPVAAGQAEFLWGLPFFFGRTVYTAIENQDTPGGPGPYVAF